VPPSRFQYYKAALSLLAVTRPAHAEAPDNLFNVYPDKLLRRGDD